MYNWQKCTNVSVPWFFSHGEGGLGNLPEEECDLRFERLVYITQGGMLLEESQEEEEEEEKTACEKYESIRGYVSGKLHFLRTAET